MTKKYRFIELTELEEAVLREKLYGYYEKEFLLLEELFNLYDDLRKVTNEIEEKERIYKKIGISLTLTEEEKAILQKKNEVKKKIEEFSYFFRKIFKWVMFEKGGLTEIFSSAPDTEEVQEMYKVINNLINEIIAQNWDWDDVEMSFR